jgi:hypothetical protein
MGSRHMTASTRMRHRPTGNTALAVSMRIATTVKVTAMIKSAAIENHIRPRRHDVTVVTSAHRHYASRGARQQHDPQPKRDSISQSLQLVHMDLSFVGAIKPGAGSRNTTNRGLIINRSIFSARPAPQTWRADIIK